MIPVSLFKDIFLSPKLTMFAKQPVQMRKLVLVIGPEATGTRVLTEILSQHPNILGTSNASSHHDCLDLVWKELETGNIDKAVSLMPDLQEFECVLSRRSMPHSLEVGKAAKYMKFSKLKNLRKLCLKMNLDLILLITTRSTVAHLAAWTLTRASTQKTWSRAEQQYRRAYLYLFSFIKKYHTHFYFLSLESLLLDREKYIQSLFQLLKLPPYELSLDLNSQVNYKRYDWYTENIVESLSNFTAQK